MKKYKVTTILIATLLFLLIGCNETSKEIQTNKVQVEEVNGDNKEIQKSLKDIKSKAENGMVINCEFKVKENVMDQVRRAWRAEDKCEQVEVAKGFYATYEARGIVFGFNKGEAIFEIRSFDKSLNKITIKDVKEFFGEPAYNVVTENGERIIGYVVNDDFKLEFVFDKESKEVVNPTIKHYQVFYPAGTVNSMASDPGRDW